MGGSSPPSIKDLSSIPQFDGNITITSSGDPDLVGLNIPIVTSFRPPKVFHNRPFSTRKNIARDNKAVNTLSLPKISLFNARSLFPKIKQLALDMKERNTDVSFITEIWESLTSMKHMSKTWASCH